MRISLVAALAMVVLHAPGAFAGGGQGRAGGGHHGAAPHHARPPVNTGGRFGSAAPPAAAVVIPRPSRPHHPGLHARPDGGHHARRYRAADASYAGWGGGYGGWQAPVVIETRRAPAAASQPVVVLPRFMPVAARPEPASRYHRTLLEPTRPMARIIHIRREDAHAKGHHRRGHHSKAHHGGAQHGKAHHSKAQHRHHEHRRG